MRLNRRNPRRDANEPAIVDALRACGVKVWRISGVSLPDLLTRYRGRYEVFKVKTAKGRKTKKQADIPWPIIRDVEAALALVVGVTA